MKKVLSFAVLLLVGLQLFAQMQPLPIDAKVRKGTLPNGLTYYIRANVEPKGQAEFFIAQKVGSMQEEESQRGLAHFLEHMCFNGTKNFPDKQLFAFLETIGVKFGENLNAYTSFEETVYNISAVPLRSSGIIDSCLLILHDWSNALLLTDKDINEERGVIREEMRTSDNAYMRIYEKAMLLYYPNSRYATRMPIGTAQIIENFQPQELRDYYHKWYRPEHQAIIVVGDINVDDIENRIKTVFSGITKPEAPSELVDFPVVDNKEPIVAVYTDKEMPMTSVELAYRMDAMPSEVKLSVQGMVFDYMKQVLAMVLNERLSELTQKADAPFAGAEAGVGTFFVSKTKDALTFSATAKDNGALDALKAIFTEAARLKKFGVTPGEYERAKTNIQSHYEKAYNEREKRKSESYAQEYARNFVNNEPIPGIEAEYNMINQIAPMLTADQLNEMAKEFVQDENIVISVFGPEKAGVSYPDQKTILDTYAEVFKSDIKPIEDKASNEPLMVKKPKAGKVISENKDADFDATVWTLTNGIKVVVRPTDYKDDEIIMTATSKGGSSLFADKDVVNGSLISEVVNLSGVASYSRTDLGKILAGKRVQVGVEVDQTSEGMSGSTVKKDLETFMQLIYLTATSTYKDADAFKAYVARMRAQLENMSNNPMKAFSDSLKKTLYMGSVRVPDVTLENLDQVNYDRILALYKDRFVDMSDFVFTFVGNVDLLTFKPLVEAYLGALPGNKRKEDYNPKNCPVVQEGVRQNLFEREMQNIKSSVAAIYSGKFDYTVKNDMIIDIYKQILDLVFTEEVREKEGGTYGVGVQLMTDLYPYGNYTMLIFFDTDPAKRDKLVSIVNRELEKIAKEGPRKVDFDKVIVFLEKQHEENLRSNGVLVNAINTKYSMGLNTLKDYEKNLKSITPADIQKIAGLILTQKNRCDVVMTGVAAK